MTTEEARKVPEGMYRLDHLVAGAVYYGVERAALSSKGRCSGRIVILPGVNFARIDAQLTADQLEAIAMWMRDPEEVANAPTH